MKLAAQRNLYQSPSWGTSIQLYMTLTQNVQIQHMDIIVSNSQILIMQFQIYFQIVVVAVAVVVKSNWYYRESNPKTLNNEGLNTRNEVYHSSTFTQLAITMQFLFGKPGRPHHNKGRELQSAATSALQPAAGHCLSFITTVVFMDLGWGLFVGLAAESCGQIWLPCLTKWVLIYYDNKLEK